MNVPDWENYYIYLAFQVAKKATCPVRQVGAVLVNGDNNAILSLGYNGAPRGTEHCGDACRKRKHGENQGACRAVHAETNAIYNAARNGVKLDGCHAYLTLSPCDSCAKALIQIGVEHVIYAQYSAYPEAIGLLSEADIPSRIFIMDGQWWDEQEEIELDG